MSVVESAGRLEAVQRQYAPARAASSLRLYGDLVLAYGRLYEVQPNVRTVVSFLARNIAQIGLKVYRRVSDTDREHLTGHPLSVLLKTPNTYTTRYRLIDDLVHDLAVFGNAYWAKVRNGSAIALVRLPPANVAVLGDNALRATGYLVAGNRGRLELTAEQVVHFRLHNPADPRIGLSPLETLRTVLAEESAAAEYRENFWRNAARIEGVLKHPGTIKNKDAKRELREQWQALYSGGNGSGRTAILEEGMEFEPVAFNARDSQYLEGRRLNREEVAAAYHVPPPMVGILENATYSNIEQQHRQLYADTLGPWLVMLEEELELQLLADFDDTAGVYVEFNLAEKLRGSFEEQVQAMQSAVGRPWMTADEARARLNMPELGGDAGELVTPLNVIVGGQASPRDSAPPPKALEVGPRRRNAKNTDEVPDELEGEALLVQRHVDAHRSALEAYFERQQAAVLSRLGARKALKATPAEAVEAALDADRWTRELTADLVRYGYAAAAEFGGAVAAKYDLTDDDWSAEVLLPWVAENAEYVAGDVTATTLDDLKTAAAEVEVDDDGNLDTAALLVAARAVFEVARTVRAERLAVGRTTTTGNFGRVDAAAVAGVGGKVWVVTSSNPRESHAALDGEVVEVSATFSNGAKWPGDPALSVDERAGCSCLVDFE